MDESLKIEIWSDIVCPFCYIGKRRLEAAMERFEHKDRLLLQWHSYQLDPDAAYEEGMDIYTYLANRKGQRREWSVRAHEQLADTARTLGLDYRFDIVKPANSFDAQRLIQLAASKKLEGELEERLFRAYFTEGVVISDHASLQRIATEAGLDAAEVQNVLQTQAFAETVRNDVAEGENLGLRGVPFFVFDRRYAVAGAQDPAVFLEVLNELWQHKKQKPH